jgi:hypothetical protein
MIYKCNLSYEKRDRVCTFRMLKAVTIANVYNM